MKISRFAPVLLLLLFSAACVEQFKLKDNQYEKALVVDGSITNQPGPYWLRLKYSTPANEDLDEAEGVTGATITLHDNEGLTEQYTEVGDGKYITTTPGLVGVVGRTYYLTINVNGKEYTSKPSTMYPSGTIGEMYGSFEENVINSHDLKLPQDAIRIYFSSSGAENAPNMFRWRWEGTYEVQTFPELRMKPGPRKVLLPNPFPCSGLEYRPPLTAVFVCECCHCYVPETSPTVMLTNNDALEKPEYVNQLLATLPYESERFYFKYRIKMQQISLDQGAYDYWKLVKTQQESRTDVFQPNVVRITGNITCTSDPEEKVLGLFTANAVTEKVYDIPFSLKKKLLDPDTIINDCRAQWKGSTNEKPSDW